LLISTGIWDSPPDVVIAVVIGVVALFMKDYDTTGNGKEATKEE